MTLGNMRDLGVQRLVASCLNDACQHTALIDVSKHPAETEVPWFRCARSAPSAAVGEGRSTCAQTGKNSRLKVATVDSIRNIYAMLGAMSS
jgi:hypothetical protein